MSERTTILPGSEKRNPYFIAVILLTHAAIAHCEDSIPIAQLDRNTPVDFQSEILPILQANCIACHNGSKAESELNLASPAAMRTGGSQGPAIVPGQSAKSLLLAVAAHEEETFMPPADNKVGARSLTSGELGLLKLWVDQGAHGEAAALRNVHFQPLPTGVEPIFATAVTRDGQFAACGRGKVVCIYHVPTQQLVAQLAGHDDIVRSLAFDPSGERLASGGFRQVKIWRRPHVDLLASFKVDGAITALAGTPDGRLTAIGLESGQIRLRNAADEEQSKNLDAHTAAVTGLAFSADGKTLYSSSKDKTIRIVDRTGDVMRTIATPAEINAMALINDGAWLVTGHEDNVVRIWDLAAETGEGESTEPRREIKGHSQSVTSLAASPDDKKQVISGSADGTVRLWNAELGEQLRTWNHGSPVTAIAMRPDGVRLASAGEASVKLWKADDSSPLAELRGDPRATAQVARIDSQIAFTKSAIQLGQNDIKAYEGPERRVKTTAEAVKKAEDEELAKAQTTLNEKQESLAKAKENEKSDEKAIEKAEKELADAQTARDVALTIIERAKVVAERAVTELADAKAVVAADEDKLKQLEEKKTSAEEAAKATEKPIRTLIFTADNRRLISGGEDALLQHYDATFGSPLETMPGGDKPISTLAIAADGKILQGAGDGAVRTFNVVGQWELERTIGSIDDANTIADRALALAFSPNGESLAVGGGLPSRGGELKVFRTADGQLVKEFNRPHNDTVLSAGFSPDGKRLAAAGADRAVKIFNVETGEVIHTLAGHTAHVTGVGYSAGGKLLISSGADRVLKLWDAETGGPMRTMKGTTYRIGPYRREVTAVAFVGDSEQILAASGDGTVRLHRTSSDNDILTFADSAGYIYSAAVSDDGRTVVAGGSDGVLRLWSGHERSMKAAFPAPSAVD